MPGEGRLGKGLLTDCVGRPRALGWRIAGRHRLRWVPPDRWVDIPMKAVAVIPGKPNSVHLRDIPAPGLTDQPHPHVVRIPDGHGVLVKVLQVGVDATDREINEALYGNA